MLIKPTAEEAEKYIDFAYELALDPTRSGYPTYTDGIKTKEDFIECCHWGFEPGRQVLLYLENDMVSGWIEFLLESDDQYIETTIFNIRGNTALALREFIEYCDENYFDHTICMGFPGDNQAAVDYLMRSGWTLEEHSYNDVLCFDSYILQPEDFNVVRVARENYTDFRKLHEAVQGEMYWNADRLYEAIDKWDIFVYYQDGKPAAAIYNRDAESLMHIYGIDYVDNIYCPGAFRVLMCKVLNVCKKNGKKHMVYFGEQRDQQEALDLGYRCVGEYKMFSRRK